jgi:large subunit ribosomal protein L39e
MGAHKSLIIKKRLGKKERENRPLANWFRYKTDNKIRYNAKRRNWRKIKLKVY